MDLSQIIIDDIVPSTPTGDDAINDETVDFVHTVKQEVKDTDRMVVAQLTPEGPDAAVVSLVVDPMTVDGPSTVNPTVPDAPLSRFPSFYF